MDDITTGLQKAFSNLKDWLPNMPLPRVYAQIGALDQSIVIGDRSIGISLDKYMGAKYPLYKQFGYTNEQLETMGRNYIVPDCVSFYLLSQFPMNNYDSRTQLEKDLHMGKVMWTVNKVIGQNLYNTPYVKMVDRFMKKHSKVTVPFLMMNNDIQGLGR